MILGLLCPQCLGLSALTDRQPVPGEVVSSSDWIGVPSMRKYADFSMARCQRGSCRSLLSFETKYLARLLPDRAPAKEDAWDA